MPYIKKDSRPYFDAYIGNLERDNNGVPYTAGELNYFISKLLWRQFYHSKSYAKANEIVGLLECIKQEFYRRVVGPYEDVKCQENGDVNLTDV